MLAIAVAIFVGGELKLSFVDGLIDATIKVFALVGGDEGIFMFGFDDEFGLFVFGLGTVKDYFDALDEIVILG